MKVERLERGVELPVWRMLWEQETNEAALDERTLRLEARLAWYRRWRGRKFAGVGERQA